MCTVILFYKILQDYPVVLAHNRDELKGRGNEPPQVMGNKPLVIAPKDIRAGGTWSGFNMHGLVVSLTNTQQEKINSNARSRGHLVMDCLKKSNAREVLGYLSEELFRNNVSYNHFNLAIADSNNIYRFSYNGDIAITELKEGVLVLPSYRLDNSNHPEKKEKRINEIVNMSSIKSLDDMIATTKKICNDHYKENIPAEDTICVHGKISETSASTVFALGNDLEKTVILHANSQPCMTEYKDYSHLTKTFI